MYFLAFINPLKKYKAEIYNIFERNQKKLKRLTTLFWNSQVFIKYLSVAVISKLTTSFAVELQ